MKRSIAILILLVSFQLKAQEIYNSYNINGSDEANGGTYTYEAKVSCKSYLAGMGDIRYQLSVSSYKITSFSYNGINAENIDGLSFPISKPNIQADVYFNLSYKEGSRYFDTNESKMLAVGQGYGDYADLSSSDVKKMVDYFGLKSNQDFQKLSIILSNIHIKKSYFEELSEAQNLIKQKIQTDNKIEQLKSQINSLGNSKEDLLKKKSLYQKLNSLDKENSYDSDISNIENDLKQVARNELDKEEKEEENNTKNNNGDKDKNENKQDEDEDYEKIKQQEKENRDAARVTQQNWQYYENYKAKIEELRRKGQTNTEEYREYVRLLKMTESALPINHYDKYSTKIAFQEGATKVVNTFRNAVQDGTISGLRLSIGTREFNEERGENGDFLYSDILSSTSYEIGIGMGNGGFTMGGSFFENGYTLIGGLYYNAFPGLINDGDKFSLLSLGFGAEIGFGTYDNDKGLVDGSTSTLEDMTFYSPGIYILLLNDIIYFSYNYGWTTGEETISTCCGSNYSKTENSLKGTYTKLGFGINIKF